MRLTSHRKLMRELAYAERKQDASLARLERENWEKIHKIMNTNLINRAVSKCQIHNRN